MSRSYSHDRRGWVIAVVLGAALAGLGSNAAAIEPGKAAVPFTLLNQADEQVSLESLAGKWTVLYFYPMDDTPGCTIQANDFTAGVDDFAELNARVVGVSPDDTDSHRKFIEKFDLKITLLSDPDKQVMLAYGGAFPLNAGDSSRSRVQRSTVLIDPDGNVAYHWPAVRPQGHAQDVKAKLIELQSQGFVSLFDGETLSGWHNPFDWGTAEVYDGEIHLSGERKFFLVTDNTYSDFILEVEVSLPVGGNSGVQFRSHYEKNKLWGYQAEIDTAERRWSGGFYEEGRRGWLQSLEGNEQAQAAFKNGQWNKYRITCMGDHITIHVNGVLTADAHDSAERDGYIALQQHGEAGMTYRFRNIRIKPIDAPDEQQASQDE